MYLLTGDGDGADIFSAGVLKSLDGGLNWNSTALSTNQNQGLRAYKMVMHPTQEQTLFVVSNAGILKTTNGFNSLDTVQEGFFTDIEFKPGTPSTMYAARSPGSGSPGGFYKSDSSGNLNTWARNTTTILDTLDNTDFTRIAIGVTPDDPNYVYLLYGRACSSQDSTCTGYKAVYRSINSGTTITLRSSTPNILGWNSDGSGFGSQAMYDLAFTLDPMDKTRVFVGGINIWKSVNSATNWEISSHWVNDNNPIGYTHADIHMLEWSGTTLYAGTDGGFFRSTDGGENWTNLSAGLGIMQFFYLDVVDDIIVGGSQDNGSSQWTTSTTVATMSLGGDGFACAIDYSNTSIRYLSFQDDRRRTTNGGFSYSTVIDYIIPGEEMDGFWDSDFLIHPTDPMKLVNARTEVYLSSNRGDTWTVVDPGLSGGLIIDMVQGVVNPDRLYVTNRSQLKMTNNLYAASPTFADITSDLPLSNSVQIEQITIDPTISARVWVALTGYDSNNKVFFSANGGIDWNNFTANLPNVPVNAIAFEPGSNDGIYVGTDIGVFYRNANMSEWIAFNNGLPNVSISEFDFDGGFIYAATYGRGIWRTPTYTQCVANMTLTPADDPSNPLSTGVQRYSASSGITSTRIVTGGVGTDVIYQAGNAVLLNPGFEARVATVFQAKIGGCPD
jgi:hypothetical protein